MQYPLERLILLVSIQFRITQDQLPRYKPVLQYNTSTGSTGQAGDPVGGLVASCRTGCGLRSHVQCWCSSFIAYHAAGRRRYRKTARGSKKGVGVFSPVVV